MDHDELEEARHRHRLHLALKVIQTALDLPLRILHRNALGRVKKALEESEEGSGTAVYQYVSSGDAEHLLDQCREGETCALAGADRVLHWLAPLVGPSFLPGVQQQAERDRRILQAMWVARPAFGNPAYAQLKDHFWKLRALCRLDHLDWLWGDKPAASPADSHPVPTRTELRHCPIGGTQHLDWVDLHQRQAVLVAGPVWLEEKLQESYPALPMDLAMEQHLRYLVGKLIAKFEDASLNEEEHAQLLRLARAYPPLTRDELDARTEMVKAILEDLFALPKGEVETLHASEWVELVRRRTFHGLLADTRLPGQKRIRGILGPWRRRPSCYYHRLAERPDRRDDTLALKVDLSATADEPIHFELAKLPEGGAEEDYFGEDYRRFARYQRTQEAWHAQVFLDRLAQELRLVPFGDRKAHRWLLVERAMSLTLANVGEYFSYDSIDDRLDPQFHFRNPRLHTEAMDRSKSAKGPLDKDMRAWSSDADLRRRSSVYCCLDGRHIVSRFDAEEGAGVKAIDAVQTNHPIDQDSVPNGDSISVPLLFQGRPMGVLHVSSIAECGLRYEDRLNLFELVQIFESELFEAHVLKVLSNMATALSEALQKGTSERAFCDSLMVQVARLMRSAGALLLLDSGDGYRLLGFAGVPACSDERRQKCLSENVLVAADDPLVTSLPPDANGHQVTVRRLGRESAGDLGRRLSDYATWTGILVNERREEGPLGLLWFLDRPADIGRPSPHLEEVLRFVSQELGQVVQLYRQHQKLVEQTKTLAEQKRIAAELRIKQEQDRMRNLVAHDAKTAFRTIQGKTTLMEGLTRYLPHEEKRLVLAKGLEDIRRQVREGKALLDYFSAGDPERQAEVAERGMKDEMPLTAFAMHRHRHQTPERVSVYKLIEGLLHDRKAELRRKDVQPNPYPVRLSVWLNEDILGLVLTALVDNVVKYARPHSLFTVREREMETSVRRVLALTNEAAPLPAADRDHPEVIFSEGKRGREPGGPPGEGLGMYLAREYAKAWGGGLELFYRPLGSNPRWAEYRFELSFPSWLEQESNPWHEST